MATRMKMSVGCTAFHRVAADNDMPASDVGTSEANLQGLGGSGDWQIDGDNNVTIGTAHAVFNETESAIGSGACTNFLYIKNTGYTSATKDTAVDAASFITVGLGGNYDAVAGFKLYPGQAIMLPGPGDACDDLADNDIDSSVAATYVEIFYS
tara:strand:+ start:12992 stop:13450 length:459 start_codon:yes stop_codon:yes gene_type:complete